MSQSEPSAKEKGWGPQVSNPLGIPDNGYVPVPALAVPKPAPGLSPEVAAPAGEYTITAEDTSPDGVLHQRGAVYGPNPFNQETVGKMWTSILESHFQSKLPGEIPPHIVGLMMVGIKLSRAACPFKFNADNFVDAHNYLTIAHHCDPRSDYRNPILNEIAQKANKS